MLDDDISSVIDPAEGLMDHFEESRQSITQARLCDLPLRGKDKTPSEQVLRLLDSNSAWKRSAFGLSPELMASLMKTHHNAFSNNQLRFEVSGGSAGIEALWHLDNAAPSVTARPADIAKYEDNLLKVVHQALSKPQTKDSEGRNGLHCLAAATFARLKYLSSDIARSSTPSKVRIMTSRLLNDRTAVKPKAELVKDSMRQSATFVLDLVACGVDVNSRNSSGNAVLMDFVAFLPEETELLASDAILDSLIHAGAKLEARNWKGASVKARDLNGRDAVGILNHFLANPNATIDDCTLFKDCLDRICQLRDEAAGDGAQDDPEDGITPDIANRLRDRRSKIHVSSWEALWQTLFPGDEKIKPSVEAVVTQYTNGLAITPSSVEYRHRGRMFPTEHYDKLSSIAFWDTDGNSTRAG
ncbi:hypothetical protein EsH8_VI_000252 [Colletotrichum jinshuiense]